MAVQSHAKPCATGDQRVVIQVLGHKVVLLGGFYSQQVSICQRERDGRLRRPQINTNHDHFLPKLTQVLADCRRLLHGVHAVVVESHVEGVALVLVLHPLRAAVALRAAVGLWGGLQSGP